MTEPLLYHYAPEQPPCTACGYRGHQVRRRGLCCACYAKALRQGTTQQYALKQHKRTCDRCGKSAKPRRRGMCRSCYIRWWRARKV